jgi:hypothetical protein
MKTSRPRESTLLPAPGGAHGRVRERGKPSTGSPMARKRRATTAPRSGRKESARFRRSTRRRSSTASCKSSGAAAFASCPTALRRDTPRRLGCATRPGASGRRYGVPQWPRATAAAPRRRRPPAASRGPPPEKAILPPRRPPNEALRRRRKQPTGESSPARGTASLAISDARLQGRTRWSLVFSRRSARSFSSAPITIGGQG